MLDKDRSEHYAAGSVLVERALAGIQSAIDQLTSLQTAEFETLWQSSAAPSQQQTSGPGSAPGSGVESPAAATVVPADTTDSAEASLRFLASSAKHREAVMLHNVAALPPQQPSLPSAAAYQAALLAAAPTFKDTLLNATCNTRVSRVHGHSIMLTGCSSFKSMLLHQFLGSIVSAS